MCLGLQKQAADNPEGSAPFDGSRPPPSWHKQPLHGPEEDKVQPPQLC